MKRTLLTSAAAVALAAAAAVSAQDYRVPSEAPAYIREAVQSDARPAADRERDAARKPAEVLMLSGVEPGDRVIEIAGFGQYYTRMLADIVGENGIVGMYDLPYTGAPRGGNPTSSPAFVAEHPNTEYHLASYDNVVFPDDVDVAFNVLYYHDLGLNDVDRADMNARIFDALKPGGAYLIIDHKAEDGSGWRDTESLHRMGAEVIVEELTAAGFELETDSDLLANPDDDRTAMVFAPGTRGATDRAVLLFRKPE